MYTSPNYAKGGKGKSSAINPDNVISIVLGAFAIPVYEPLMAEKELVLSNAGDLLIAKAAEVPLILNTP